MQFTHVATVVLVLEEKVGSASPVDLPEKQFKRLSCRGQSFTTNHPKTSYEQTTDLLSTGLHFMSEGEDAFAVMN